MADADKPPMPESKPTVAINSTDIIKAQLTRLIDKVDEQTTTLKEHRSETADSFKHLTADVELVSSDLSIVKSRVTILESYKNDADARATRTSARVQQASQVDLEQASQLARERAAREALAKRVADLAEETDRQTVMLTSLTTMATKLAANPYIKQLSVALLAALTGYLAKGHL
ncbi:MAG: hypothetical protein H0U66_02030 [Gemmatimonadaceae bacterium]|nr:hypothetical protein [Gemmatimonadaceae bacterium]